MAGAPRTNFVGIYEDIPSAVKGGMEALVHEWYEDTTARVWTCKLGVADRSLACEVALRNT